MTLFTVLTVVNCLVMLATLAVGIGTVAICLKLYTEYFKDRSQARRKAEKGEQQ